MTVVLLQQLEPSLDQPDSLHLTSTAETPFHIAQHLQTSATNYQIRDL